MTIYKSAYRKIACGILIQARLTNATVHMSVLCFSLIFRMVLVLHAHKGLVRGGRPDLKLFRQLFWVITCTWTASPLACTMYVKYFANGTFPSGLKSGKLCLLLPLDISGDGEQNLHDSIQNTFQHALILFFSPSIGFIWLFYFKWRVTRFMKGICPSGKMSCVGVYRRNVISFNQTFKCAVFWSCFSPILSLVLQTVLSVGEGNISRNTAFWIWNMNGFACDFLLSLLPFVLKIPPKQRSFVKPSEFFVIYPQKIEPRRFTHISVSNHKEFARHGRRHRSSSTGNCTNIIILKEASGTVRKLSFPVLY